MTGLSVNILIPAAGYDSTNGGATGADRRRTYRTYVLFDEEIEYGNYTLEECKDDPEVCCLKVVRRWVGTPREYLHIEPMFDRGNSVGSMFGGNYVTSSDSRFRDIFKYPLPVHDRWEN